MTDDDFLIDESDEDAAGGEEEDLLADVGGSDADRLNQWETDSQISGLPMPTPTPAPQMSARGAVDELDEYLSGPSDPAPNATDDLDELLGPVAATQEISTSGVVSPAVGKDIEVLVVDPRSTSEDSPPELILKRMGFSVTLVETGGAVREALMHGRHEVVFFRIDGDAGWARMLMATSGQKWPNLKFMASVPGGTRNTHLASLQAYGAHQVLEEPLNSDVEVLKALQAVLPDRIPMSAIPAPAPVRPAPARQVTPGSRAAVAPVRAPPAAAAAAAPAPRADGELTQVKSALAAAQKRARELEGQLGSARAETDNLRAQVKQLEARPPPAAADGRVADLRKILTGHPYATALDHALAYFQGLAEKSPADTALARHVKNLRAVRAALKKAEEKLGEPDPG